MSDIVNMHTAISESSDSSVGSSGNGTWDVRRILADMRHGDSTVGKEGHTGCLVNLSTLILLASGARIALKRCQILSGQSQSEASLTVCLSNSVWPRENRVSQCIIDFVTGDDVRAKPDHWRSFSILYSRKMSREHIAGNGTRHVPHATY